MSIENIKYLPLYDRYFHENQPENGRQDLEEEGFASKTFNLPLSKLPVDFSIQDQSLTLTWQEAGKRVVLIVLKMILFPWGLYELSKYTLQRLIMIPIYPAQSRIIKSLFPELNGKAIDQERAAAVLKLNRSSYLVREVVMEKNGVRYNGLLIGRRDNLQNGRWVLQATGNAEPIESCAPDYSFDHARSHFNTLLINGPSVGKSEGTATPDTIGDAQEIGLSFLETAIKAHHIVMAGFSLGGAAIGLAIEKHSFNDNVRYLALRQMTFGRLSSMVGTLGKKIIKWAGCEMDSVAASRKLAALTIKEVIVQAASRPAGSLPTMEDFQHDGCILPQASLGYALIKEGVITNKTFVCLPEADHSPRAIDYLFPQAFKSLPQADQKSISLEALF